MLNPKHQRYSDRLKSLIEEGHAVALLEKPGSGKMSWIHDYVALNSWLTKTETAIVSVFGKESGHYRHFDTRLKRSVQHASDVNHIIGILTGGLNDLENGFLTGQEFFLASEIFDSLLEQAKHLNSTGYKDPAAVMSRVVLEDALKRLARANGIAINGLANRINDDLKAASIYPQPQWRLNQACLDVGNDAAHGNVNNYTKEDVAQRIEDIERFLATYFTN